MDTQTWYRLEMDYERNPYSCIRRDPVRPDGEYLSYKDKDHPPCTLTVGRQRMMDVAFTIGCKLLFSERLKQACLSLRIENQIEWTPVQVQYSNKTTDSYWALSYDGGFDALDTVRSVIVWLLPGKVIGSVSRWVLNRDRIPRLDLFTLKATTAWIVSGAFRARFESDGLAGAAFHPCELYPPQDGDQPCWTGQ